ncbi:MAG: glycerol-3-phosphate 1-O-acyltransferase PlsY [Patescibacteria group bacterium]
MFNYIVYFVVLLVSYTLGSIPTAYLVVKKFTGKNILEHGTGNVGTMNTHRTTENKWLTLLVLIGDLAKGGLAYLSTSFILTIAFQLFSEMGSDDSRYIATNLNTTWTALAIAFFGVILGHNYSIWLKFKGGKGLATAAGFLLGLNPLLVPFWGLIFFLVVALSQFMVLGQIIASALLPLVALLLNTNNIGLVQFWIMLPATILVVIKHAPRMKNVLNGSEPKMYYKIRNKKD